jgi:hypothetical protein
MSKSLQPVLSSGIKAVVNTLEEHGVVVSSKVSNGEVVLGFKVTSLEQALLCSGYFKLGSCETIEFSKVSSNVHAIVQGLSEQAGITLVLSVNEDLADNEVVLWS